MKNSIKTLSAVAALCLSSLASGQITFYEHDGYLGRTFAASNQVDSFVRYGFNDRASSVIVDRGRWEVCEDTFFTGRCVVLRAGSYESLSSLGLNNRISSVRPVRGNREYSNAVNPSTTPVYEYRRRPSERIREAPVTSVRAVMGAATERCWTESQPVRGERTDRNVGGAVLGALLGGVLGHQVGGGTGKDIATVGGAIAGGVIGSNVGRERNDNNYSTREVRRCENTSSSTPAYYDVAYNWRGVEHHAQMSNAPGPTIQVNAKGEPRI